MNVSKGAVVAACVAALSVGCASSPKTVAPASPPADAAVQALSRSATDVSRSIRTLAEVEQYDRFKKMPGPSGPYQQIPDMVQMVTMPWEGPIESAVRELSKEAGYTFKVSGRSPVIPVLVKLSAEPATISDQLRNLGLQAGSRADVTVYPGQKIVELRYSDAGI